MLYFSALKTELLKFNLELIDYRFRKQQEKTVAAGIKYWEDIHYREQWIDSLVLVVQKSQWL